MAAPKNPIAWTEIYVNDLDRATQFYETVLGIKLEVLPIPQGMDTDPNSENYFEMRAFPGDMPSPGSSGALVKSAMFQPGPGGTLVYFACANCAVELSRVSGAGGKVIADKMPIGEHGFCGICEDTEGNTIGFHSMG
jgi:uncharacterized protein